MVWPCLGGGANTGEVWGPGGSPANCPFTQRSPTFLAPGTGFVEDSFSMDRGAGDGSGGDVRDGAPLTSCCVAQFLTGRGPVPVRGLGVGDPCFKESPAL